MKTIELPVEKRSTTGKNEARRSRAGGRIPAVVYGAGKPNVPISVDRKALSDLFREGAGENAIFLLKLAGSDQSRHAMRSSNGPSATGSPRDADPGSIAATTRSREDKWRSSSRR